MSHSQTPAVAEEVVKAKIARIQEGHARASDKDEVSGKLKFAPGDQVEINRGSGHKDISSWKGPGTVVSIGDPVTGDLEAGVRVKYQGGEEHVTFDQVRPFIGFAEIFAVAGDVSMW